MDLGQWCAYSDSSNHKRTMRRSPANKNQLYNVGMYKAQEAIWPADSRAICWKCDNDLGLLSKFVAIRCPKCKAMNTIHSPLSQEAFVFWRGSQGEAMSNLEQMYVLHSPDGFEWGYGGSGPADLAFNMVQYVLLVNDYKGERTGEGWFVEAETLHQQAKWDFVARLPEAGGRIDYREFEKYIMEKVNAKQER